MENIQANIKIIIKRRTKYQQTANIVIIFSDTFTVAHGDNCGLKVVVPRIKWTCENNSHSNEVIPRKKCDEYLTARCDSQAIV